MDSKLVESPTGIRKFSNEKLQSAIDDALSELSGDTKVAVVAHGIYLNDGTSLKSLATLSAAVKIGNQWSIMVAGYKDFAKGDLGAEAKVVWKI